MTYIKMLKEVCKYSAIQATTALSKFLNIPLGLEMKIVEIQSLGNITTFSKINTNMISVFLPISGPLPGACFFLFTESAALSLCDVLFHKPEGKTQIITEPEISALTEVANIMIGNFLTTFSHSLHLDMLMHRSPIFDFGTFEKIIQKRFPVIEEKMQEAVLSVSFGFQHVNIQGHVLIIFSEEKLNHAISKISSPTRI